MYLPKSAEQNVVVNTLSNDLPLGIIRSENVLAPIISVSVAVGHYHESDQCYGFAHLLEHMIFHRSKHFGDSDTLEKHISKHGGYINGWTHACHTNFHLSCNRAGFIEAVEMLCDKVVHPTLSLADIATEIAAIDEEFQLKREDPVRGLFSVKKAIANSQHPFHRFTVGNHQTFSSVSTEQLQAQLQTHHTRYFHSGNMAVCLKLPRDRHFDELVIQLREVLSRTIPTKEADHSLNLPSLYTQKMTHKWVNLRVKHSHCQLVLCWLIEKKDSTIDISALKMLRQLIESKHKNGLFDILTTKHWVRALSFTGGIEQTKIEEVQLHLTLSPEGANNVQAILNIVAGFIGFLAHSQIASWRFNELEKQLSLFEKYGNKKNPVDTCIDFAQSLHDIDTGESQQTPSLFQAKTRTLEMFGLMRKCPHHIYYIDESSPVNQQSEFYNVPYSVADIPLITPDTSLPFVLAPQNAYLPAHLLLVGSEIPADSVEVIKQHGVVLKFAQIVTGKQPCGDCFISINSPAMCGTLDHIMSKKIWVEAFEKYLQRRFYQADDAGISFRIYGHQHGLTIHTTGFSEKQLHLCIEIINCMIAFRLNENEFMQVKDAIIKRLTNRLLQKPVNQMFASLNTLIQGDTYSISQQVAAVRKLQFSQLDTHQIEFFHQVGVEALMAGNWRLYAAQRMHQQLQSRLTARGVWQKPIIVAKAVDQACLPTLPKITARDTAVVLYQQVRKLEDDFLYVTEHATAICLVLENILSPYIFLRLRNDKQLAYLVGVGYKPINMQPGIAIYVQSSKASAGVIYHAVQQVITELLENWQQTELDVEQIKPRIIEQCKPMDRDVSSIARRLWANFEHLDPYYHYQNLQKAVERLPAAEIKRWLIKLRHANEGQILLTNDTDALEQEELLAFTHNPTVN